MDTLENLNITLFCLDYARDSANLSVTKEQIAEAKEWLLGMVEHNTMLLKQRESYINANVGKGLDW